MKKRLRWLLPIVLIVIVYLIPVSKKDAAELYDGVDKQPINGLTAFRKLPTKTRHTQGYDWTYLVLGNGPKTILFLHGMTGGYDFWWQQMNAFSHDYRVVSMTYPPVDNLSDLGKGVISILDKEKIDSVIVVGSSLGGYLTQYLLATYPQRVEKAVLGNTFPKNDIYEEANHTKVAVAKWLPEWAVMNALRGNLVNQVIPASENNPLAKAQLLENTYGRMSKAQFLARYQCVIDKFQPIDGKQTKVPLLILESDNDPLILLQLRTQLKQYYTTAQVHTFHQKGHFPYLNAAKEYNTVLGNFLRLKSE
ncbi:MULTISPECIES: alpha/beta hydrolase [unclassified Spirosoma]|uniref:alpha/beta fold hydrolase n=1 Tax=unclassified Spirosoma TaxID=2621999 RepID=UPI00095AE3BB|nr:MULTISPECIES: alpha/beta hydrolase [unclassified Spirosoma]MBN8820397.1 alpha/beta hydrolase [Spirosoma sp.]OJW76101.1 MAG: alpha/beta hydrolase [Spirosoma sp. 48-14]